MFDMWTIVMGLFVVGACSFIHLMENFLGWFISNYPHHKIIQQVCGKLISQRQKLPMKKRASLNLHIVSKKPLFDKEPCFELFIKYYPKDVINKNALNVVFIVESNEPFRPFFAFKETECSKGRIVTHSCKQMYYHMYYSSPEYTKPDAVLLYKPSTMLENEEDAIHSEISYRNMTSKKGAMIAVCEDTKDELDKGVNAVKSGSEQPRLHVWDYEVTPISRYHFTFIQNI